MSRTVRFALVVCAVCLIRLVVTTASAATRTWIGGDNDWIDNGNPLLWDPNDEPDTDDTAVFNTANSVNLGTSNSIQGLTLTANIDLFTNGQDLTVDGLLQSGGGGTILFIDDSTSLVSADTVAVNAGGTIRLRDGTLTVDEETGTGFLDINAAGTFSGNGTVNLNDAPAAVTSLVINDGTISAVRDPVLLVPPPGTLTINASAATARIYLDGGAEAGVVNINRNQTLEINGTLQDAFTGDLNMFHDTTLDISAAWSMDGGTLDVVNGFIDSPFPNPDVPAGTSTIAGGAFTQTGGTILNFDDDGTLIFDAAFTQSGGSFVNNGLVVFNGSTLISSTANMTMPNNTSSITVGSGATVNVDQANFNADGNGTATNVIRVNGGGNLDLDLGAGADDTITGSVVLSGGELDVTTADNTWSLGGNVSTVAGSGISQLNGEELTFDGANVNVASGTTLDVNAANTWDPAPGSSVVVDGLMTLEGAATFVSGIDQLEISGTGTLRTGSTSSFSGLNIFFNIATFDWDGTTTGQLHTIQPSAIVRIDTTSFDSDGDIDDSLTVGAQSALRINDITQWEMLGTLTTNGAAGQAALIGGDARMVVRAAFNVDGETVLENVSFGPGSTTTIANGALLSESVGIPGDFIYDGGTITGAGTFIPAAGDHNTVAPSADSTISAANFDLDAGNWLISAFSSLTIHVADYDTNQTINRFDSTITLDGGEINVNTADAEFVMDGTLIMRQPVGFARWDGEPLDIGNDDASTPANVIIEDNAHIGSQVDFNADANVTIDAGASLLITDTANFDTVNGADNAAFTGEGTFILNSEANFNEATVLDMAGGAVDFDGSDLVGNTINVDAPVSINAETFAAFGNANVVGGADTLNIDSLAPGIQSGRLIVNLGAGDSWTLNPDGVMNFTNDNIAQTLLFGSPANLNGDVNVTGNVGVGARIHIGGTVNIPAANSRLTLIGGNSVDAPNTLTGGMISGAGVLAADSGRALSGFGTIATVIDFDGTAELVANGGVLDVNSAITDVGTIRVKGGATLDLGLALNTSVTDSGIVMEGGTLQGAQFTIDAAAAKSLRGFGTVNNFFVNNGTVEAQGGTLLVEVDAITDQGDLDGTSNLGRLRAAAGANLTIREFSGDGLIEFAGTAEVQSGAELFADFVGGANAVLDFVSGSSTTLTGGTLKTNTTTGFFAGSSVVVGSGPDSLFDGSEGSETSILLGGAFTLNGNLQVKSDGMVPAGATFSGAGALHLLEESVIAMNDGANVDVLVINDGALNITSFANSGRVDVADFQQSDTGALVVTLEGTDLNEFDRMVVSGAAELAGTVAFFMGPFVPSLGDSFNIVSTSAGLSGAFDQIVQPPGNLPPGLFVNVRYTPFLAQAVIVDALPGDFNRDGFVDTADFIFWRKTFGQAVASFAGADGNGDGTINDADYNLWRAHFGTSVAPGSGADANATVPEPAAFAIVVFAACVFATRCGRVSPRRG